MVILGGWVFIMSEVPLYTQTLVCPLHHARQLLEAPAAFGGWVIASGLLGR